MGKQQEGEDLKNITEKEQEVMMARQGSETAHHPKVGSAEAWESSCLQPQHSSKARRDPQETRSLNLYFRGHSQAHRQRELE